MASKQVTLKEVGEKAGISAMAVSMALRNHPRIAEKTRRRVQALAARLGYVRNPAFARIGSIRGARPREMMPMALVRHANPTSVFYHPSYMNSLAREAARFGYRLQFFRSEEEAGNGRRLGEILYHRGIEAVVLGPIFHQAFIDTFPFQQFSVVACEAGHFQPPCHLVMSDILLSMERAVRLCLERGYRRIALAEHEEPMVPVDALHRQAGRLAARHVAEQSGAAWAEGMFPTTRTDAFHAWLGDFRPDVVIGQTAFFYWELKRKWKVPREVAFVTLRLGRDHAEPELSGFMENHMRTGALAIKLLDGEVRDFERGTPEVVSRILVEMDWKEGRTLPVRAKKRTVSGLKPVARAG